MPNYEIWGQARSEPVWDPGELRSLTGPLAGCLTPDGWWGPSDTAGPGVSYPLTLPLHGPVCEKLHKRMYRSRVRDVDELKSRLIEEWEHYFLPGVHR